MPEVDKTNFKFYEYAVGAVSNRNQIHTLDFQEGLITKKECYRSLYSFDEAIINYLGNNASNENTSISGYKASVWSDELVIDIDFKMEDGSGDIPRAKEVAAKLLHYLETNYELNLNHIIIEFSGSKGFHLRIPAVLFGGFEPSLDLPKLHKQIVQRITDGFEGIDLSVYNATRLMRIPNTQHQKTNLYSIPLRYDDFFRHSASDILTLAEKPNLAYEFVDGEELIENEALVRIKENIISEINSQNKHQESDTNSVLKADYKNWPNIISSCNYLSDIVHKSKKKYSITNEERLFLASLAVHFGSKGELEVHKILNTQENYSAEKTNAQLEHLKSNEYKPFLCKTVCKEQCTKIKAIAKNSPIAFAFSHKEKYIQTKALLLFAEVFSDTLLFMPSTDRFYFFENGYYKEFDEYNLGRIVGAFLMQHFKANSITEYGITSLIRRMKMSEEFIYNGKMNPNPLVINLRNGMYDLINNEFIDHSRNYKSTVQLNVEYDEHAKCNLFEEKLDQIFDNDKDKIEYFLQWMLYCLIPSYEYQKFLILYGTGRNGKGVLTSVLTEMLGKTNCSFESFSDLSADRNYSLINLLDKYVNISSELSNRESETDIIKRLTGGDPLSTRDIYKGKVQFTNFAKLIVSTNSIPRVTNLDKAFLQRVEILEFTKSFEGEPDTKLVQKLKDELSGIFNLLLTHAANLIQKDHSIKLTLPASLEKDKTKYLSSFHSVAEFIEEKCETPEVRKDYLDKGILLKTLYSQYAEWCKDENGYHPVGKKTFCDVLQSTTSGIIRKVPYVKSIYKYVKPFKSQMWVLGISLIDSAMDNISYDKSIREAYAEDSTLSISIHEEDWIGKEHASSQFPESKQGTDILDMLM